MKKTGYISPMAIHPGETVAECLESMCISQYRLAKDTALPATRISQIIKGKRGVTADTALRFGKFFGNSPEFWMNLQSHYDLTIERLKSKYPLS